MLGWILLQHEQKFRSSSAETTATLLWQDGGKWDLKNQGIWFYRNKAFTISYPPMGASGNFYSSGIPRTPLPPITPLQIIPKILRHKSNEIGTRSVSCFKNIYKICISFLLKTGEKFLKDLDKLWDTLHL